MQRWLTKLTTLHWALLVSLGLHLGLLTFRFIDPERFDRVFRDTPLEVILVNARTSEAPALILSHACSAVSMPPAATSGNVPPLALRKSRNR